MKTVSVCVPCYNESSNIIYTYERVTAVMKSISDKVDYEIVFADNKSLDGSQAILRELADRDARVKVILNMNNFGPGRSGLNCLLRAEGDAVVSLPCDLQEPPELIPDFVDKWLEGNLVVWGRKTVSGENGIMYRTRSLYYRILGYFSEIPFYDQVDGFGIVDRQVIEQIAKYRAPFRGMKILVGALGFEVVLVPYKQEQRVLGKSSYGVINYFKFALDTLVETSMKPLFAIAVAGGCSVFVSLVSLIASLVWVCIAVGSESSLIFLMLSIILFFCSLNMLCLGVVGTYVAHIFKRGIPEPLVIEQELINFDDKE